MLTKAAPYEEYHTKKAIEYHTLRSMQRAEEFFDRGTNYALDEEKDVRITEDRECRFCYYILNNRIAGQAFTKYECGICHETFNNPNTDTPDLCYKCADDYGLCCRCGAKLDA